LSDETPLNKGKRTERELESKCTSQAGWDDKEENDVQKTNGAYERTKRRRNREGGGERER